MKKYYLNVETYWNANELTFHTNPSNGKKCLILRMFCNKRTTHRVISCDKEKFFVFIHACSCNKIRATFLNITLLIQDMYSVLNYKKQSLFFSFLKNLNRVLKKTSKKVPIFIANYGYINVCFTHEKYNYVKSKGRKEPKKNETI